MLIGTYTVFSDSDVDLPNNLHQFVAATKVNDILGESESLLVWQAMGLKAQEALRIVERGLSNILTYDIPRSFLQIEYLTESACKSDSLVCVSYDSHCVRPCRQSIQYSSSKKASYQGVMIIKMPFVSICVSIALVYLSKATREKMQVFSKQISKNCFLFIRVAFSFVQTFIRQHSSLSFCLNVLSKLDKFRC